MATTAQWLSNLLGKHAEITVPCPESLNPTPTQNRDGNLSSVFGESSRSLQSVQDLRGTQHLCLSRCFVDCAASALDVSVSRVMRILR